MKGQWIDEENRLHWDHSAGAMRRRVGGQAGFVPNKTPAESYDRNSKQINLKSSFFNTEEGF